MAIEDILRDMQQQISDLKYQLDGLRKIEIGGVWQDWTPTFTGWSANPANGIYRYCLVGKMCTLMIRQGTAGTSNATTTTLTAPFTSVAGAFWNAVIQFMDNGTNPGTPGMAQIQPTSNIINFYRDFASLAWTASGNKAIHVCVITYAIA